MTNKSHFSLLLIFISLLLTSTIRGQLNLDYAFTVGSTESDFYNSFKVDQSGNYYMLSEYLDSMDYPNPAVNKIHINCESTIDNISLFTMEGSQVYVPITLEGNSAEVSLHGISAGMYFLKANSGNRISVSKIVKQ